MKPTPKGWPRISSSIFYDEPKKAIEWLCRAFGFEVRLLVEGDGGRVEHSELTFGDGLIMVGAAAKMPWRRSPRALGGGSTQAVMVYVDDIEAHCKRAREAGASILAEPTTHDYGEDYWTDRAYECADPEGHHWWFSQRLRDPK
jgi:uncharacterized glyoxalase superfamily protein PhnB